jgi:hypothetical protein
LQKSGFLGVICGYLNSIFNSNNILKRLIVIILYKKKDAKNFR